MPAGAQPHNFILSSIHLRKLCSALVALASGAEEHCFIETGGQDTGERPGWSDDRWREHAAVQVVEVGCVVGYGAHYIWVAVAY